MIAKIRYPELFVLLIEIHAGGIADQAFGSLQNPKGRYVATGRGVEHQNRVSAVISHEQLISLGVERKSRRPVHLGVWALNHAHRRRIAFDFACVNGDRRRQQFPRAGHRVFTVKWESRVYGFAPLFAWEGRFYFMIRTMIGDEE